MNHISPHCAMTTGSFGLLLAPTGIFWWDKEILIQEQMCKQHNCTTLMHVRIRHSNDSQVKVLIIYSCHNMCDCWWQTLRDFTSIFLMVSKPSMSFPEIDIERSLSGREKKRKLKRKVEKLKLVLLTHQKQHAFRPASHTGCKWWKTDNHLSRDHCLPEWNASKWDKNL